MNPFHEISDEIDRFYERNNRGPDFVLVGLREWMRMTQMAGDCYDTFSVVNRRFFVHTSFGKVEVRPHLTYYSMIAPVLEKMP